MTELEKLVTEISLRAAAKVYPESTPEQLASIADSATEMIVEMIVHQEAGGIVPPVLVPTETYGEWHTLCELMNEIGKEIPITDRVEIVCKQTKRSDRMKYEKAAATRVKRVQANLGGDGKQPEIKEPKRGRKRKGSGSQA